MKLEKSARAKRNMRYQKNRQKRIAQARKSAKETIHESESSRNEMPNQQRLDTPQQTGMLRDEPHAGNDRPLVLELGGSVLANKHMETLEGLMPKPMRLG